MTKKSWILFATTVMSHFTMVPTVYLYFSRGYVYEAAIAVFGILSSFMYHTCQSFNTDIILEELQWHHLDNIAAISAFGMWCVFICCFRNSLVERGAKYVILLSSIILQEKDPWNVAYATVPVLASMTLPVGVFLCRREKPDLNHRHFGIAFVLMGTATCFFVMGLNDELDSYRIYHGMWHLLGGIASYFMWVMVRVPGVTGGHFSGSLATNKEDVFL